MRCNSYGLSFSFFLLAFLVSHGAYASGFSTTLKDFVVGKDQSIENYPREMGARLPIESQSAKCMKCHDGSNASGIKLKHADTAMKFTGHGSSNHPVGMNYRVYASRDPAVFVAPEQLDSRIILENGEVTCISCHALKLDSTNSNGGFIKTSIASKVDLSPSECMASNKLTIGPNSTRLCLSCHAM